MRSVPLRFALLALILIPATAQAYLWCDDTDVISVEIDPATGDLLVRHDGAQYNCCPDPISYEAHFGDATLFVIEHIAADPPCDCDCCFDLVARIPDPQPGPWIVRFSWFDLETGDWVDWHGEITVPDAGQGYVAGEPQAWRSECIDTTGVSDPIRLDSAWSAIKSVYR